MQLLPGNRNWRHLLNRWLLASIYNTNRFLVQALAPSIEMALRTVLFIEDDGRVQVWWIPMKPSFLGSQGRMRQCFLAWVFFFFFYWFIWHACPKKARPSHWGAYRCHRMERVAGEFFKSKEMSLFSALFCIVLFPLFGPTVAYASSQAGNWILATAVNHTTGAAMLDP